ncbi:hypothetical protein CSC94_18510 [Zhengella mangrovi]|uniref:General secretion pathway protein GspN n=1 Tax=Zhengella mangrovi TaxID=1982044 RepID=A0A2G1QJ82_9HYPH|nr:hypothetical protein [Zhengella mangrovi]PHP65586.1 hypothetical protein CSC94_18510 [Zhengella mangrovi]
MTAVLALLANLLPAPASAFDFGPLNALVDALGAPVEERPLFDPDRRPPLPPPPPVVAPPEAPPSSAPVVVAPQPDSWKLLGIVRGEGNDMVVVLDTLSNETFRLAVGESRDGWSLVEIGNRDALLAKDEKTFALGFPRDSKD